jgi:ABC-type transport system involved in Fe-S cluster assembly fused permease/ATPase subunit
VSSYQKYSVSVQYSLSLLNIVQQLLMQGTMCGAMIIMIYSSDDVGAFVAVQAYLIQLFTPLNFLGTSTHLKPGFNPTARLGLRLGQETGLR